MASVGISTEVLEALEDRKNAARKSYTLATLLVNFKRLGGRITSPTLNYRLYKDEHVQFESSSSEFPLYLMAIGNGQYFGKGLKICPSASLSSETLQVVLIHQHPMLTLWRLILKYLPQLKIGTHTSNPECLVQSFEADKVILDAASPIFLELDGELVKAGEHVTIFKRPLAIRWLFST